MSTRELLEEYKLFEDNYAYDDLVRRMAEALKLSEQKALAYDEWMQKTDWMDRKDAGFQVSSLGKHKADVLREEIERLRSKGTLTVKVDASDAKRYVEEKIAEVGEVVRAREILQEVCGMYRIGGNTRELSDLIYRLEVSGVVDRSKYPKR